MASNYRNSAGTDLDNLFYVGNSNLGAIGFKMSNGVDLGNRYSSGSLGYNVGLKNSAGTDLGYLRGRNVSTTVNVRVRGGDFEDWGSTWGYADVNGYRIGAISNGTILGKTVYNFYTRNQRTYLTFSNGSMPNYTVKITKNIGSPTGTWTTNFETLRTGWGVNLLTMVDYATDRYIPIYFDITL